MLNLISVCLLSKSIRDGFWCSMKLLTLDMYLHVSLFINILHIQVEVLVCKPLAVLQNRIDKVEVFE